MTIDKNIGGEKKNYHFRCFPKYFHKILLRRSYFITRVKKYKLRFDLLRYYY